MQLMLERWPAPERFSPEPVERDSPNLSCAEHLRTGGRTQPSLFCTVACFNLYAVFATGFWALHAAVRGMPRVAGAMVLVLQDALTMPHRLI